MKSKFLLLVLALTAALGTLVGCNMKKDSIIPDVTMVPGTQVTATAQPSPSASSDDNMGTPDASATAMPSMSPGATTSAKPE